MTLLTYLQEHLKEGYLPLETAFSAMKIFTCHFRDVEGTALKNGILPLRYKRNQKTITSQEQLKLFQSKILIVGCGGLGGFVAEILTRIGVGELILCDGDVFEEHNLNRQNFSSIKTLGRYKAEVLKEKLEEINPALHVTIKTDFLRLPEDAILIQNADVIVDALDDTQMKCLLAQTAKKEKKAFVHAAIAGYYTQFSTNATLESLYLQQGDGAEKQSGNPAFTVCFAASIQSIEVVKLLLGKPHLTQALMGDLLDYEWTTVPLEVPT
jgi:molybdopterin/thiamine biosynthesis adenylyltransferase